MKVKIGDKIIDAEDEPILVILSQFDKDNIRKMSPDCFNYLACPVNTDPLKVKRWVTDQKTGK